MTRPVRLGDAVREDIRNQLDTERAARFWQHDLPSSLALLTQPEIWDSLPSHSGGRRLTLEGLTVGAFHVFATVDDLDPRPGAIVVYAVDIWPDGFPKRSDPSTT